MGRMRIRRGRRGWTIRSRGKQRKGWRSEGMVNLTTISLCLPRSGGLTPRALRTAHAEGGGSLLMWRRPRAGAGFLFSLCYRRS